MIKLETLKNAYINAFLCNDKYIKEMIIINTKCLIDDKNERKVYIDYKRQRDEIIYHKFYGSKCENINIINVLLPIIISNKNIDNSEKECIKNITYHVKFIKKEEHIYEYILSSVIYNSIINSLILNSNIEYEELLQNAKQRIIELEMDIDNLQIVKYQMARIKAIQSLDKYIDKKPMEYNEIAVLNNILDVIYQIYIQDRESYSQNLESIKKSILSILDFKINLSKIDNIDFINSLSEYILKLRGYKVNKNIYSTKSDPRYLISLNVGDNKLDPILNSIKIEKKIFENKVLTIFVSSKSGQYIFKFIQS